jgi:cytochrome c-type biogenesis protein CcmE
MHSKTTLVIAGLLIVAAVIYLMVSSTGSTARYFLTIEELYALEGGAAERGVTVSGAVLGDTIAYDASVPRVTFAMAQVPGDPKEVERAGGLAAVLREAVADPDAARLEVVYDGVKPDLLQHEAQAIVRGRLERDGRLYADEVLLKCPTRYAEELPDQTGGP